MRKGRGGRRCIWTGRKWKKNIYTYEGKEMRNEKYKIKGQERKIEAKKREEGNKEGRRWRERENGGKLSLLSQMVIMIQGRMGLGRRAINFSH